MLSTTTVRLYFRNIMFFVHREDGTDVWFHKDHSARLYTREREVSIAQSVVQVSGGGAPLPRGPHMLKLPLVISFNTLAPDAGVSQNILARELSEVLIARVELPGGGTLTDRPSAHSHGALLDWETPTLPNGELHVQRLTEIAVYELRGVSEPVHLVVDQRDGSKEAIEVYSTGSGDDRVAEAFFLAGEESKSPGATTEEGDLVIHEFRALHDCFDSRTRARLENVIPRARKPRTFGLLSAEPFCPNAQIDLRQEK